MNELESLLPAVEIIAGRVWKKYGLTLSGFMEFDDLYQHGVLTMYRIAHRYNPESPASFKTYMGTRVYGAMLDRIYDDPIIPIYKKSRTRGARAQMVPLPDEG